MMNKYWSSLVIPLSLFTALSCNLKKDSLHAKNEPVVNSISTNIGDLVVNDVSSNNMSSNNTSSNSASSSVLSKASSNKSQSIHYQYPYLDMNDLSWKMFQEPLKINLKDGQNFGYLGHSDSILIPTIVENGKIKTEKEKIGEVKNGKPLDTLAEMYGFKNNNDLCSAAEETARKAIVTAQNFLGNITIPPFKIRYTHLDLKEGSEQKYIETLFDKNPAIINSEIYPLIVDMNTPSAPALAHEFTALALRGEKNLGNFPPYELTYPQFYSTFPGQLSSGDGKFNGHLTTLEILLADEGLNTRQILSTMPSNPIDSETKAAQAEKALASLGRGMDCLDGIMHETLERYVSDPLRWDAAHAYNGNYSLVFLDELKTQTRIVPTELRSQLDELEQKYNPLLSLKTFFDPDSHAENPGQFPYVAQWDACLNYADKKGETPKDAVGYWKGYFENRTTPASIVDSVQAYKLEYRHGASSNF